MEQKPASTQAHNLVHFEYQGFLATLWLVLVPILAWFDLMIQYSRSIFSTLLMKHMSVTVFGQPG